MKIEKAELLLRQARQEDIDDIGNLFQESIMEINKSDYSTEQLEVWTSRSGEKSWWQDRLNMEYFLLAYEADELVGFGSIYRSGYLNLLYVHKDHQRKGIARAIYQALEDRVTSFGVDNLKTEATITARPFFEKMGFQLIRENVVEIDRVKLTNFLMQKSVG